ncbi:MAG: Dihydropteroate synthase [Rhodopila sp.]|nr:Dihydropteroate synthase [Rhodopila sp.]
MTERVVFLTGHLALPRLRRILEGLGDTAFTWDIVDIGVQVAALMTEAIILRRLTRPVQATRVILPGRAGVDPQRLTIEFGVPFERGPDELADLPAYLGRGGSAVDLSHYDVRIFAEIVDAPLLPLDRLLARAEILHRQGADVIDIGCRPGTPFDHLEAAIAHLHDAGLRVSLDSGDLDELRRGAEAGADFLLSLTEDSLDVAAGTGAVPVLVPRQHGDLESLVRAADKARALGMACLLDPILDPIHFGFTASLTRYAMLRERLPDVEILMGTGNLTELTDADSAGVTAMLMGICSELAIRAVLVVQVSPHTRETVAEHDFARRLMFAARANSDLPRNYGARLLQVHDRVPFVQTADDVVTQARAVRDPNYRIATAEDGIHVFNNSIHEIGRDAMSLYPVLDVANDGAHGFYLGTELMKAETAFALGKRYVQDAPLDWGLAAPGDKAAPTRLAEAGHTLRSKGAKRDDP